MANRIAGTAYLWVNDTNLMPLRGNFIVSPSPIERIAVAGQLGVNGFQEVPRVPYIEGEFSTINGLELERLDRQTDVTVCAQLANGMQYTLSHASCKAAIENNPRDGIIRLRWEGLWMEEGYVS